MKRENRTKDVLIQLVAIMFLATSGIFVRHCSLSPITCGFYRVLFSMIILYPFVRKHLKSLTKKEFALLVLAGAALGGDIAFCNIAFSYTSIANVSLLTNMTAFIVVPVSYFFFKEKIPKMFFPGAIIAIIGVVILIKGKSDVSGAGYFGDFLAIIACAMYALFLLISYRIRDHIDSSTIMFVGGFGGLIATFIPAVVIEGFQVPTTLKDLSLLLGLTLCMQVIGQNLVAYCQGKLSANLTSIIGLTQPVFGALLSWIAFREVVTIQEWIGIFIVIIGVYLVKAQYKSQQT
ncbi:MAG: DMT family transporter [Dorea sp.]